MQLFDIPLIIRGEIIDDAPVTYEARRGVIGFRTPDVARHLESLILHNPVDMQGIYALSTDEIIDFLDALGRLLTLDNPHIARALEMNTHTGIHSRDMLATFYAGMSHTLSRPQIEEIADNVFGRACLDGWESRRLSDRTVRVRAMGSRTVHLNAGNGPPIVLFGLINGTLLRGDNIVKSPSNDPYTAAAVVQTMIEMAPNHPITRRWSVAYWKGGTEAIESVLYRPNHIEKIVAWGGFASMGSIRKYLKPGMDLVALDPKLSASLIGPEAFADAATTADVARRIARDIGLGNQGACASTRVVYVESGTDDAGIERLNALGRMIHNEVQALPDHLSSPHPAFDPVLREELGGIRYSDAFRVFGGRGNEGAVIVSQASEPVDFADRLDCRVANLVPVDRIEDALRWLTIDTQTIAVYPESLKTDISLACALRGGQRLTSIGCTGFQGMAYPQDSIELGRRLARWVVIEDYDDDTVNAGAGFMATMLAA